MHTVRRSRRARLPFVAVSVAALVVGVLSTGDAWARGRYAKVRAKPVTGQSFTGTDGGAWTFLGCAPAALAGTGNPLPTIPAMSVTSPPSQVTITWAQPPNRRGSPLTTTVSISVRKPKRSKCTGGGAEYLVTGRVLANSATPGVKGKVRWSVCDKGGAITDLGGGRYPKKAVF